jgi:hypothetical protein
MWPKNDHSISEMMLAGDLPLPEAAAPTGAPLAAAPLSATGMYEMYAGKDYIPTPAGAPTNDVKVQCCSCVSAVSVPAS